MLLPTLGLSAFKPVEQIFGGLGDALGIGGKSDAEKAQIRVARARDLLDCALRGDIAAARTVLAEQTYSSQPEGRQAYAQAWQQLQAQRPDVALQAQRAGPLRDSTSSGACTRFELGSSSTSSAPVSAPFIPFVSSAGGLSGSPIQSTGSTASSSSSSWLPLAGIGLLAVLALRK